MEATIIGSEVHYVNAADGQHLVAKVVDIHPVREMADLDVEVPIGDGKRFAILHDEELKAGNTWHFIEPEHVSDN